MAIEISQLAVGVEIVAFSDLSEPAKTDLGSLVHTRDSIENFTDENLSVTKCYNFNSNFT